MRLSGSRWPAQPAFRILRYRIPVAPIRPESAAVVLIRLSLAHPPAHSLRCRAELLSDQANRLPLPTLVLSGSQASSTHAQASSPATGPVRVALLWRLPVEVWSRWASRPDRRFRAAHPSQGLGAVLGRTHNGSRPTPSRESPAQRTIKHQRRFHQSLHCSLVKPEPSLIGTK